MWWLLLLACTGHDPDFRGARWGGPPAHDMVRGEDESGATIYRRPGEPMTLGGAQLVEVKYAYWRDRLMLVGVMAAAGSEAALCAVPAATYGDPVIVDPAAGGAYWSDGVLTIRCRADGTMIYRHDATWAAFEHEAR